MHRHAVPPRSLVALGLALAALGCASTPDDDDPGRYRSPLGFSVVLPETWQLVDLEELGVGRQDLVDEFETLSSADDSAAKEAIREHMKQTEIEFFFMKYAMSIEFSDNVNVSIGAGPIPTNEMQRAFTCQVMENLLTDAMGQPIDITTCELTRVGRHDTLHVVIPQGVGVTSMSQYHVDTDPGKTLVLTATTRREYTERVEGELRAVIESLRF